MDKYIERLDSQKFSEFYNWLQKGNEICNLTTITDRNEVFIKHFLDSILPKNILMKGRIVLK